MWRIGLSGGDFMTIEADSQDEAITRYTQQHPLPSSGSLIIRYHDELTQLSVNDARVPSTALRATVAPQEDLPGVVRVLSGLSILSVVLGLVLFGMFFPTGAGKHPPVAYALPPALLLTAICSAAMLAAMGRVVEYLHQLVRHAHRKT